MSRPRFGSGWVFGLFLLSGAAGLSYQLIWIRMFSVGLGHELPAALAVISAFFGGLALGGWSFDRAIFRSRRPWLWFAAIELVIGFWGAASVFLIPRVNGLAPEWIGLDPSPLRHWLVAFLIPLITLAPATLAMGASLPAMERLGTSVRGRLAGIGGIYGANTAGAVAGTLLSIFFLMPRLGFPGSLFCVAVVNGLVAAGAVVLRDPKETRAEGAMEEIVMPTGAVRFPGSNRLLLTLFLTGFLGIAYEVVTFKLLAQTIENTVFSYAAVLAVFLAGTAAGGFLYERTSRRFDRDRILNWCLITLAGSGVFGVLLFPNTPALYQRLRQQLGDSGGAVAVAEMTVAATVLAVPTICMGALFSLLVESVRTGRGGVGRAAALNTLGAACAPGVAGVLLVPGIGAKWTLLIISAGYLLLLHRVRRSQGVAVAVLLVLVFFLPAQIRLIELPPRGRLLAYDEGTMDAVAVVEHFDGNKSLVVNNRFTMGGTGAAVAELRQGHIPLLLHPRPTAALFLGLGTGISFAAARSYPELFAVGVELLPEVVQQMSHFNPYNDLRGAEDRLRVIVADARRFVAASTEQFDVIVADLFHPARDGAAFLYTREHFHAVRKRLRREGLFCQWLPIFQLDEHGVRSITRTFLEVFPNACAFLLRFNVDTPVVGLIASTDRQRFPADLFAKRVAGSLSIEDLRRVGLRDELHLLGCFLAGPDRLRSYAAGAPINQDSSPAVLFGAPAYATRRDAEPYETLLAMLALQDPPKSILEDPRDPFAQELNRFVSARTDYLLGLMADARGESERALDLLLASAGKSEEFTTSYAHVLSLASQKLKSDPEMARKILLRLDQSQPSRPIARELLERMNAPSGR